MINNYRSRSCSFKSFKEGRASISLPPSALFTPAYKKVRCKNEDNSYLGISYASPQQYYTNQQKNCKLAHLECHLTLSHSTSINRKRFPSNIFEKESQEKQPIVTVNKTEDTLLLNEKRQKCLYNYFANMAKKESQQEQKGQERPKSKSILLIRKFNKKKEQVAEKAKERLEQEFRNRKQIPIHHTQFHFHKRKKSKTQHSPSNQQLQQKAEFTQKIHRAVEEILRLRATLNNYQNPAQFDSNSQNAIPQQEFKGIIIEGGNFSTPPQRQQLPHFTKTSKFSKEKKKIVKVACTKVEENEISPWVPITNDFQFLL